MRKIIAVISFLCLFQCATTSGGKKSAVDGVEDPAAVIAKTVMDNAGKLPDKKIAVLNFTDISGEETDEGRLLAEQVIAKLAADSSLMIVERTRLDEVLKEQQLSLTGITETNDSRIGKILNIDAFVSGTIAPFDDNEEIYARMTDVKTGAILCAVNSGRSIRMRQKDMETLPPEKQEQMKAELEKRKKLRTENPEIYRALENHKKELWKLREKDPAAFDRVMKTVVLMENLRKNKPRLFLLVTEPTGSPRLQKIMVSNPGEFERLKKVRESLGFIIAYAPEYRALLGSERKEILQTQSGPRQKP